MGSGRRRDCVVWGTLDVSRFVQHATTMSLLERISQDIAAAMRAKEQVRLGALRMAKAALMNREVERGRALDGDGVTDQTAT